MGRNPCLPLLVFSVLFCTRSAIAQDGAYGRVDTEASMSLAIGGFRSPSGYGLRGDVALSYLETLGLYAGVEQPNFSHGLTTIPSLSSGVEVRPLFLPRFLNDYERGPVWFDLAIDSLALRIGAVAPVDQASSSIQSVLGVGMGLPILGHARGPWIRCSAEWRSTHQVFAGADSPAFVGSLLVEWRHFLSLGLLGSSSGR